MTERRRHRREDVAVRVRWQPVAVDASAEGPLRRDGPHETSTTRDLSRGGVSFEAAEPLAVDTVLALEILRGFGGPPLSALGRVIRCARDGDHHLVGVEFTWIECEQPAQALGLDPANAWTLL